MEGKEISKGFAMNLTDEQIVSVVGEEGLAKEKELLARPYKLDTEDINDNTKLYLLLMVFMSRDNGEDARDFEFFEGTRQQVYDYIKELMMYDDDSHYKLSIDESLILVDSPKIRISHKCTFYTFMKSMYELGKIKDDNYNIEDYHDESIEEESDNGEE